MKPVKVFWKDPCPYCVNAKRLLDSKAIPFESIDLSDNPEEMSRIKNETGWRTVPIIMIDGKLIGGYTDLKALDESGELDRLLK